MYTGIIIEDECGSSLYERAGSCIGPLYDMDEIEDENNRELRHPDYCIVLTGPDPEDTDYNTSGQDRWLQFIHDLGIVGSVDREFGCITARFRMGSWSTDNILFLWTIIRYGWESYMLRENILSLSQYLSPSYALWLGHWYWWDSEHEVYRLAVFDRIDASEPDAWNGGHALLCSTFVRQNYNKFSVNGPPLRDILPTWERRIRQHNKTSFFDKQEKSGRDVVHNMCIPNLDTFMEGATPDDNPFFPMRVSVEELEELWARS